mmetsp:Transcript_110417/g.319102  ORF Transcript_110417/g.319102 Transcript_110417/m.319102 type:complete len:301 (-) Transcript_110417:2-904(-)
MASKFPARAASSKDFTLAPLLMENGMLRELRLRSSTLPINNSPDFVVVLIQPVYHSDPTFTRRLLCTPNSKIRTVTPGFKSVTNSLSKSSPTRMVTKAFTSCMPPTSKSMVANCTCWLHFMTRGSLSFVLELIHPSKRPCPGWPLPIATLMRRPWPTSRTSKVVPTCKSMRTSLSKLSSLRTVTRAMVSHMSPADKSTINATEAEDSLLPRDTKERPFLSTLAAAEDALEALDTKEDFEVLDVFVVTEETLIRSSSCRLSLLSVASSRELMAPRKTASLSGTTARGGRSAGGRASDKGPE